MGMGEGFKVGLVPDGTSTSRRSGEKEKGGLAYGGFRQGIKGTIPRNLGKAKSTKALKRAHHKKNRLVFLQVDCCFLLGEKVELYRSNRASGKQESHCAFCPEESTRFHQ